MSSNDGTNGIQIPDEINLQSLIESSESLFRIGEIFSIVFLFIIFTIGLYDIAVRAVTAFFAGNLGSASAVISLLDTLLLLFIVVEAKETVVAYAEKNNHEEVVSIVLFTGIIAVVRRVITFHTSSGHDQLPVFLRAASYTILIVGLAAAYYITRKAPDI